MVAFAHLKYIQFSYMQSCPDLPIILYISNSGALVERMAACQPGEQRWSCFCRVANMLGVIGLGWQLLPC